MKACAKHAKEPVKGYAECPGCEVESLRNHIIELEAQLATPAQSESDRQAFDAWWRTAEVSDSPCETAWAAWQAAPAPNVAQIARFVSEEWQQPDIAQGIRLQFAAAPHPSEVEAGQRGLEAMNSHFAAPIAPSGWNEREQFEAWWQKRGMSPDVLGGTQAGPSAWYYFDDEAEEAWQGWQARADLATGNTA